MMQDTTGLIPHVDPSMLFGSMPTLWRVLDADPNPYAVGDVVWDSLQSIAGVPVVRLVGGAGFAGSAGQLARQVSLLASPFNEYGVVVGVAPAVPFAPGQPTIAAGGGSGRYVWVLRAASILFDVRGDASAPARGEVVYGGAPALSITADIIAAGGVTASLRYTPAAGVGSGVTLNGASFNLAGDGELAVVELAPSLALKPAALYRVRLRFPKTFTAQPGLQGRDVGVM